ncbi:MAG: hypothetical protein QM645_05275 [Asticcacaulis sp.]
MPKKHGKYHLRADEATIRLIISKLSEAGFRKVSLIIRLAPERMTQILSVRDPRYITFTKLRIFMDEAQTVDVRFEETSGTVDFYLNANGLKALLEAWELMLKGQWDFQTLDIWFWGILPVEEYHQRFD